MREKIMALALFKLSEKFDEFIAECMDENGKPIAPSHKSIMRARGYLPPSCKTALKKITQFVQGGEL